MPIDDPTMEAIQYLVAECNYGGRITDTHDRRLLLTLLQQLVNSKVACKSGHYLAAEDNLYPVPQELGREAVLEKVRNEMNVVPHPQGLGLSHNSAIVRDLRDSKRLLKGVLLTQPGIKDELEVLAPEGKDATKLMLQRVRKLNDRVPNVLNSEEAAQKFPVTYDNSLNNVLRLELSRYNNLISCIHTSLEQLEKALKGEVVMSLELERTYESLLFRNELPVNWRPYAFRTEANLREFLKDLGSRVDFYNKWIREEHQNHFWLKAFYMPQAFLTAIKLNYARKQQGVNVRQVHFKFHLTAPGGVKPPEGSCLVTGLYLEGARWDPESQKLQEAVPKVFHEPMPPVWLEPITRLSEEQPESTEDYFYPCPVYRTQLRQGEILPTGHSTNYIFQLDLPSEQPPQHWINRGVAAVLELCEN